MNNFQENPPPKDGTFVLLLVKSNENNLEDSEMFWTIGFNSFDNTQDEDIWRCVGWDWCQDEIIETTREIREIIGWLSMPAIPNTLLQD